MVGVLLCGCANGTVETISDMYITQPPAEPRTICLELPEDAAAAVMNGTEGAKLYLCGGYELRLQTLDCLALDEALRTVTGYGEDRLTVMKTREGNLDRYDCAWCSTGEEGELVGRTAILHDGSFYYCISAMADSADAFELTPVWQTILGNITLR